MRVPGIYLIINLNTGRHYVGQTNNLHLRSRSHFGTLRRGVHSNRRLQASYNKHGEQAFVFYVAETCGIDRLTEREQHWIDLIGLDRAYNLAPVAGCCRGVVHTPETLAKRSAKLKGRIQPQSTRDAVAKSNASRVISEATREKIRAALSSRVIKDETRAKLSAANKGRPLSDEHKKKLSAARSKLLVAFGKTMTVAEWSADTGLPASTIEKRIAYGWAIDDALSRPHRWSSR